MSLDKARVYIETTIPSFYWSTRREAAHVARREWTRDWWDFHARNYELVTSATTLDELRAGSYPHQQDCLDMASALPDLSSPQALADIVRIYWDRFVMPRSSVGDAFHLAYASWHKCDVLLTWNCEHLANARKTGHIRTVNQMLGLWVPQIVTPLELLTENP